MITGRVCDRCREPVDVRCITMDWRLEDGTEPDRAHCDLCRDCAIELHRWLRTKPEEILEARKTPLMRYAEELRARAETMPLKEAVGEVPEGILVVYPSGKYGMTTYDSDGMTLWGRVKLAYDKGGITHIIERGVDTQNGAPALRIWGHEVDNVPFMLDGRWGAVVNAKKLGRRLTEKKKW